MYYISAGGNKKKIDTSPVLSIFLLNVLIGRFGARNENTIMHYVSGQGCEKLQL